MWTYPHPLAFPRTETNWFQALNPNNLCEGGSDLSIRWGEECLLYRLCIHNLSNNSQSFRQSYRRLSDSSVSNPPTHLQRRQVAHILRTGPRGTILLQPSISVPPGCLDLLPLSSHPIPSGADNSQAPARLSPASLASPPPPWPPASPLPRSVGAAPLRDGGRESDFSRLAALTHWLALGQKVQCDLAREVCDAGDVGVVLLQGC